MEVKQGRLKSPKRHIEHHEEQRAQAVLDPDLVVLKLVVEGSSDKRYLQLPITW